MPTKSKPSPSNPIVYLAYLYHPGTEELLYALPTFYLDRALGALSDHFTDYGLSAITAKLNDVLDVEFRADDTVVATLGWMAPEDEEPCGLRTTLTGPALLKAAVRRVT
jgi:hypothetical protein